MVGRKPPWAGVRERSEFCIFFLEVGQLDPLIPTHAAFSSIFPMSNPLALTW
jgi:hypothetical protein